LKIQTDFFLIEAEAKPWKISKQITFYKDGVPLRTHPYEFILHFYPVDDKPREAQDAPEFPEEAMESCAHFRERADMTSEERRLWRERYVKRLQCHRHPQKSSTWVGNAVNTILTPVKSLFARK
jgi:hypothetical protein